jgi:hypothetical protein
VHQHFFEEHVGIVTPGAGRLAWIGLLCAHRMPPTPHAPEGTAQGRRPEYPDWFYADQCEH